MGTDFDLFVDSEGYEFQLISMDRQWNFEAMCQEDRDDWVMHIERAIMTRLQLNNSDKRIRAQTMTTGYANGLSPPNGRPNDVNHSGGRMADANEFAVTDILIQNIRSVAGNDFCADCGAPGKSYLCICVCMYFDICN